LQRFVKTEDPTPDAIQLACAAAAGIDLFITNDDRLSKFHVQGIHFITGLDQAPI
jgi:predicted nucleic acid-binding protein